MSLNVKIQEYSIHRKVVLFSRTFTASMITFSLFCYYSIFFPSLTIAQTPVFWIAIVLALLSLAALEYYEYYIRLSSSNYHRLLILDLGRAKIWIIALVVVLYVFPVFIGIVCYLR